MTVSVIVQLLLTERLPNYVHFYYFFINLIQKQSFYIIFYITRSSLHCFLKKSSVIPKLTELM